MADAPNTVATLNGLFKTVYADKLLDLVPDFAILQKRVEFTPADKELGNLYAQPVALAQESGFTYLGETGAVTTLGDAVAGTMKEAQVKGSELVLRAQLSYGALARASKQGPKAFKRVSSWKVEDMNNATRKRLEISMLYGQKGLGTVSSVTDLTGGEASIVITDATWAPGIWVGSEGAFIDSFTTTTKNNSGTLKISAVNTDTKTIQVTYTGTIASDAAANDVLYFTSSNAGSSVFNEMAGLDAIITASSTIFNISPATYSLWKGTTVSSVGQISHAKIQDAVARAVNKGLMEDAVVLVSPKAWSVLNSDQSALRVFDSSYSSSSSKNGSKSIEFYGTNGKLEIVAHPFVKEGDAFIVPLDSLMRIGSVDLTFGVPGMDEQFFTLVSAKNAVEIQCMCDQAIFLEKPAHAVKMTGITYA